MELGSNAVHIVQVGDLDGLGRVYSQSGGLVTVSGEEVIKTAEGWDANVSSPWRRVLPNVVFTGFAGRTKSKLYITTERVVLIREIEVWREVKEELTPLGVPAAAAKEMHLKNLKSVGARQFCEIWPRNLRMIKIRRIDQPRSWLELRLVGSDGRRYAISFWKTDGIDGETLGALQSRFST